MQNELGRNHPFTLALAAAIGAGAVALTPATAADKTTGHYVSGDFHNHTTCSDGSISMQKLVSKATDKSDGTFGLDWFVQAGHGGNGNRNCTLVEDATLATPAYPFIAGKGPTTSWENSAVTPKGDSNGTSPNKNMWRWQSVQEFQYPLIEYLNALRDRPLFLGVETVVPGHEHTSMSVITGQIPATLNSFRLPNSPGYTALGNANALAQWEYCFDRADGDTSRGAANQWDCSVPGSLNATDPSWSATAKKLIPAGGAGNGTRGHAKTLEALKWMAAYHPNTSYYVPAHLERAGPFNPDGNNGFNIEHLRDLNNTSPLVAFGFESQPGHGASSNRGEYQVNRNNGFPCTGATTAPGATTRTTLADGSVCVVTNGATATSSTTAGTATIDSVGGTTYGGTGVYAAQVGGVWDALLGEGRNWWFFASSDWHNRGSFGPDDRRTTQDFFPGEYQRTYALVQSDGNGKGGAKRRAVDVLQPQEIVDGLRSGNAFSASGQLIDRLAFIACVGNGHAHGRSETAALQLALKGAADNSDGADKQGCATMGEKLVVPAGADVTVTIVARDPDGTNYSPYTFENPSLLQIGIHQPLNMPVLDHIDLIRGLVSGYRTPGAPGYAGEWPRNNAWLHADGTVSDLSAVPTAAKNTTAETIRTFTGDGYNPWRQVRVDGATYLTMSYRLQGLRKSQYVRLRGTNMPAAVPYETDIDGNPLSDVFTNSNDPTMLRIPCTIPHSATSQFDGCPDHMATATSPATGAVNPIATRKAVSFDIAAWSDLWFYSNPIYVEVSGGTRIAGVN